MLCWNLAARNRPRLSARADLSFLFLRNGSDGTSPERALTALPVVCRGRRTEDCARWYPTTTGTRADRDSFLALRYPATIEPPVRARVADTSRGGLVVTVDGARVLH